MIKEIVIPGNPLSDNHLYGHRAIGKRVIRYMTLKGKQYKLLAKQIVDKDTKPTSNNVALSIRVYFGDKRKRDIQGHLKCLIDSFEGILYVDDSQVVELFARKEYDHDNPRTVVKMVEMV